MKLLKISFNQKCPYCGALNDVTGEFEELICDNCDAKFYSDMYGKEMKIEKVGPFPMNMDRRIRPMSPPTKNI